MAIRLTQKHILSHTIKHYVTKKDPSKRACCCVLQLLATSSIVPHRMSFTTQTLSKPNGPGLGASNEAHSLPKYHPPKWRIHRAVERFTRYRMQNALKTPSVIHGHRLAPSSSIDGGWLLFVISCQYGASNNSSSSSAHRRTQAPMPTQLILP